MKLVPHNRLTLMPLYEYECKKCGHRFEKIQKYSDKMVKKCPVCGGQVEQMISAPAVQFKGTGWYVTDYAKKSSSPGSSGSGDSSSKDKKDDKSRSDSSSKDSSSKDTSSKDSSSKESSSKESSSKDSSRESSSRDGSSKESPRKGSGRHK
ncbi:MAG TPA: zinc ribbon domain-containing protein [Candidatus Sulfotelmatobacter sp.]